MKILVIDDEPQIRRALKLGLEKDGFEVTQAASGEEALDLLSTRAFDLIVLDLALPGLDGFEICKQIRTWSQTPILVLSVRDREEERSKHSTAVLMITSPNPLASASCRHASDPSCAEQDKKKQLMERP